MVCGASFVLALDKRNEVKHSVTNRVLTFAFIAIVKAHFVLDHRDDAFTLLLCARPFILLAQRGHFSSHASPFLFRLQFHSQGR